MYWHNLHCQQLFCDILLILTLSTEIQKRGEHPRMLRKQRHIRYINWSHSRIDWKCSIWFFGIGYVLLFGMLYTWYLSVQQKWWYPWCLLGLAKVYRAGGGWPSTVPVSFYLISAQGEERAVLDVRTEIGPLLHTYIISGHWNLVPENFTWYLGIVHTKYFRWHLTFPPVELCVELNIFRNW